MTCLGQVTNPSSKSIQGLPSQQLVFTQATILFTARGNGEDLARADSASPALRCSWRRPGTPLLPHFAALALPLKEAETRGGVYLRHHAEERKNGRPLRHGDAAQKERERLQRRRGISASASFPHESASTLSPLGNPGQFHLVLCFSCSYYTTVIQTSY